MSDKKFFAKMKKLEPSVDVAYASGAGTYQATVVHYTVGDVERRQVFSNKLLEKNEELKAQLESLSELEAGSVIEIGGYKKDKYFNVTYIGKPRDDESPSLSSRSSAGASDFNTRAARGQALNLAVSVAVAEGKHMDDDFILSQLSRMLKLGEQAQAGSSAPAEKKAAKKAAPASKEDEVEDFFK